MFVVMPERSHARAGELRELSDRQQFLRRRVFHEKQGSTIRLTLTSV
jgi:hypothetical protein